MKTINGIHRSFTIQRLAAGVPKAEAENWEDAFFALGWLHARDRGGQLAVTRLVAQGRLCECLADNDDTLDLDCYFRRLGLARDAEVHCDSLAPPYSDFLAAYCTGVNAVWGRRPPFLLRLGGYRPEPFRRADALSLLKLMSYAGLAEAQRAAELFVIEMMRRGVDESRLRALFPHIGKVDIELIRNLKEIPLLFPGAREAAPLPAIGGSNAWVVAGEWSQSGKPLFAGDPHLEVNRLPAQLYEAMLVVGERWVKGASVPGLPGFLIGRTPDLAWGVTYSCADTSDFFVERVRDGNFWRDGCWRPLQVRREIIKRKHHRPHELICYENHHGMLEGDARIPGDYLCWNWSGFGNAGTGSLRGFTDLLTRRTVPEAQTAVRQVDIPTFHMVFADRAGNIGYQHTGTIPRRRAGVSGLAPMAGWNPTNDWQGWVDPARDLPSILNPKDGLIVSANEPRHCEDGPRLSTVWMADHRRRRITELLKSKRTHGVSDMQVYQYDLLSLQAKRFLPLYLPLVTDPYTRDLLNRWDGSYTAESEAAALFEAMHRAVIVEVFGGVLGRERMNYLINKTFLHPMFAEFFDAVLDSPDSPWLSVDEREVIFKRAVQTALREPRVSWGRRNRAWFQNIFLGGRFPRILGFDRGPHALPGNHATVRQGSLFRIGKRRSSFAPACHFVTDLNQDSVWTNLPGGPSESRCSRWYASDLARWLSGKYKSW